MASAVATAADVPRSWRSRREDPMTINASTNHFGNVLVVMDNFKKTDHSAPYSPTEGWYTRLRAIKLLSTNCVTQDHVMTQTLWLSPGMDQTTHKIHSIGLYGRNGGQSDLVFSRASSVLRTALSSRLLTSQSLRNSGFLMSLSLIPIGSPRPGE